MRLYLDDDSAAPLLARLLGRAGHDAQLPGDVGMSGEDDSVHLTHAARHHGEAAKHHEGGFHEKAAHHAHTARAHVIHARGHAEEAVKAHSEEHGKK